MTSALLADEGLKTLLQQEGLLDTKSDDGCDSNNIVVAVRCRPISQQELEWGNRTCVETHGAAKNFNNNNNNKNNDNNSISKTSSPPSPASPAGGGGLSLLEQSHSTSKVHSQITLTCAEEQRRYNFGFHAVFGPDATQRDVYESVGRPVVDSVLDGYNGTVFCYGQTASGKTHTILGPHSYHSNSSQVHFDPAADFFQSALVPGSSPPNSSGAALNTYVHPNGGVIPRAVSQLFEKLHRTYGPQPPDPRGAFDMMTTMMMSSGASSSSSPTPAGINNSNSNSASPMSNSFSSPHYQQHHNSHAQQLQHVSSPSPSCKLLPQQDYLVTLTFVEIYLDRVRDLIDTSRVNLPIREKDSTFFVDHVSEHVVTCPTDVLRLLERGAKNRVTSASKMNERSSRSHSILTLTVQRKHNTAATSSFSTAQQNNNNNNNNSREGAEGDDSEAESARETGRSTTTNNNNAASAAAALASPTSRYVTTLGRLQLIDLAGSERVGKSGIIGNTQLDEACAINKSLSHLSEVISAVLDARQHVPYRSCALTKLLSSSLGGNARCAIIICCSPSSYNEQETLSSLRFGSNASGIRNRPSMNRLVTEDQMRRYVSKLWHAIRALEKQNVRLKNNSPLFLSSPGDRDEAGQQQLRQQHEEQVPSSAMLIMDDDENQRHYQHQHQQGRRSSGTLLSVSAMTPEQQQHRQSSVPMQQRQQGGRNHGGQQQQNQSPDVLAMQFVSHVARFGAAIESMNIINSNNSNSRSASEQQQQQQQGQLQPAVSSDGGDFLTLNSVQRQLSPAAAASFNAEMHLALSQASLHLNGGRHSNNNETTPTDGDDENNQNLGDDQPATSREFSPAPADGGASTTTTTKNRYVSLLKEMNDAINQMDAETEEADNALAAFELRQQEAQKQKFLALISKSDADTNVTSESTAVTIKAAAEEKVRALHQENETLQMNLAVWQATAKDLDRKKSAAMGSLAQQAAQIAQLLADVEREKKKSAEAEEKLEKMTQLVKELQQQQQQQQQVAAAGKGAAARAGVPIFSMTQTMTTDAASSENPSSPNSGPMSRVASLAGYSSARHINLHSTARPTTFATVGVQTIAAPAATTTSSTTKASSSSLKYYFDGAGGKDEEDEEEDALLILEREAIELQQQQQQQQSKAAHDTSLSSTKSDSDKNTNNHNATTTSSVSAARFRSPLSLRAVEALMQRAAAAEKAAADAIHQACRHASEKEKAEADVAMLKRQAHVMEQRIIALRRVAEAERTVQHLSFSSGGAAAGSPGGGLSGGGGGLTRTGSMFNQSTNQDPSGSSINNNNNLHHQQGQMLLSPGRSRAAVLEDMDDLQKKTMSMLHAVERLQQKTKSFE